MAVSYGTPWVVALRGQDKTSLQRGDWTNCCDSHYRISTDSATQNVAKPSTISLKSWSI